MRVCPFQDDVVPLMHEASVKAGIRPNEDYNGAKLVRSPLYIAIGLPDR